MEQSFGLIMGLGVGWAFLGVLRRNLVPPEEDKSDGNLNTLGLIFLLIIMMWNNLHKNVLNWAKGNNIPEFFFGIKTHWCFLIVGLLISAMILLAIIRHRRQKLPLAPSSAFGKGQLLFLVILWIAVIGAFIQAFPNMARKGVFFVHVTFWVTAGISSLIVLSFSGKPKFFSESQLTASDYSWKPGKRYFISLLIIPALIFLLAYLTVSLDEKPLSGSHLRFEKTQQN
jgi:hypothetical protein